MGFRTPIPKQDVLDRDSFPYPGIIMYNFGTHGFDMDTALWNPIIISA